MKLMPLFFAAILLTNAGYAAENSPFLQPISDHSVNTAILEKIVIQTNEDIFPFIEFNDKISSGYSTPAELVFYPPITIYLPEPLLICKTQEQAKECSQLIETLKKYDKNYNRIAVHSSATLTFSYRFNKTLWESIRLPEGYRHEPVKIDLPLAPYFDDITENRCLKFTLMKNTQGHLELKKQL